MSALGPMAGPPPQALPMPLGPGDGDPGGAGEDLKVHEALQAAEVALHHAMSAETDPQQRAMIADLLKSINKMLGDQQEQVHQAMGMNPQLQAVMGLKQAMQAGPGR